MDTLAELDDLGADAPAEPRRDPVASVDSAEGSLTPEGEPSIPRGQQSYTQHRIGAMVLQRLFDREPPALRIGRFSVLERIGRGGMGTVYAAYDEQLDRKVAVKVLRGDERSGEVARHRLQREAQAMARLSHPNVVTVHEVGESDGDVFVAMEFIRGQSLDAWIRTEPDWREVLEVFVQAGRGLIAAHEAGLIHRDLKPHNVMRSDDGVVKVLDFGLARAASDDSLDRAEVPSTESSEGSALRTDITRPGAVLGTPAYMSPEQHRGLPADARSDQFSFCVALYEALYRQRPFRAPTLVALVHAVRSGELRAPPAEPRVPAWIHRIVVRGLSLEPKDRWPSMQALISALERDPSRAHRRWWVAAGLGSLAGLLGFGLAGLLGEPATPRCPPASAEQQALWPAARQARVAAAFETSGSPLATDTLARVSPMIDAYVGELGHMRAEACLAHRRGDQSARLLDLRTACLDVRRAGLDELLAGLEQADADTVHSAAWAAASLPSVEPCGDTEALTATVPPPDDAAVARQVQHEREALASAASMVLAGSYDEASARVEASLRAAEALGYTPLVAEARLGLGAALMEAHEHERALEALSGGLQAALRSGHDEVAVEALARRMWVRADPLRRPTEALGDDEIADALLEKLGRPALLEWLLLNNRGVAQFRAGLRSDAERSYREALASLGRQGEQLHPVQHISTRFNLAMLLWAGLGEPAAAADELRSALDRARELLGPEHPRVTVISARLAAILVVAGRHEEARALLDACLARVTDDDAYLRASLLLERANLAADLRRFADAERDAREALMLADVDALGSMALSIQALAQVGQGQVDEGLEQLRRAIELERTRAGPRHEAVANAHSWAGYGLLRAGRLDEAAAELERARELFEGLGLDAPSYLGREFADLVTVHLRRGDLTRAEAVLQQTRRAQDEAGFAPDNAYRGLELRLHGDLRLARGDVAGAKATYRRACATLAVPASPHDPELAACRLALARALGQGTEAQALARRARDAYRALGEGFAAERAEAQALLDAPADRLAAPQ